MSKFADILVEEEEKPSVNKGWINHPLTCPNCGDKDLRLEDTRETVLCLGCNRYVNPIEIKQVKPLANTLYKNRRWLDNEYTVKGKSSVKIARELGCRPQTILNNLRGFNIRRRANGK